MNTIKENPFRTLGLFGNSSEKELQKQIATIKRFAEVGKTKAFDYDFPFFGEVVRSTEKVQEAASKIEQAKNKVHYALFWFLNSGHIDEAALNNLKEGHIEKATEIWEKTLKDSTVTAKNFAAISNLSTLQLGIVTYNGSFDPEKFSASIDLKGKLLLSEVFNNFVSTVIGEGISINRDIILKEFADEILQIVKPYLNKPNGIKSSQLISAFNSFSNEIKQYVSGKFTDRPLSNIENQIEIAKQKRTDNPKDAEEYGEELYKNTKEDLVFLKDVWGSNNVQYQMIVNKLANEILQCAIDFFVEYREEDEYDPGKPAMKVMKMAKAINPTGQTKSRLDENFEILQVWIDESEERIAQKKIKASIDIIKERLIWLQRSYSSLSTVNEFIDYCKEYLRYIKNEVGVKNSTYINTSSAVVHNAMNMLINTVNREINELDKKKHLAVYGLHNLTFHKTINEALEVIFKIGILDMDEKVKKHYSENLGTIKSIALQIGISIFNPLEKLNIEIRSAESDMKNIQNTTFLKQEMDEAYEKLKELNGWSLFRSKERREKDIFDQKIRINNLISKSEQEKAKNIKIQQTKIENLRAKLKEFTL